jgi:hypothetical protein
MGMGWDNADRVPDAALVIRAGRDENTLGPKKGVYKL